MEKSRKPILIIGSGMDKKCHEYYMSQFKNSDISRQYHVMILQSRPNDSVEVLNTDKLDSQDIKDLYEKLKK